jgi:suppressor of G2 allele of SKP1
LQDCNNAILLDPTLESAYYKKGLICFELEEFETARKSFETALLSKSSEKNVTIYNRWIRKCDVEIQELDKEIPQVSASAVSSSSSSSVATAATAAAAAIPIKAPAIIVSLHTKSAIVPFNPIKYQYYQGNDSLNISVLEKNLLPEDVNVSIESDHLRVVCKGEVVIDKQLYGLVNTEKSKFEIRKSKVEILLWKVIFYFTI